MIERDLLNKIATVLYRILFGHYIQVKDYHIYFDIVKIIMPHCVCSTLLRTRCVAFTRLSQGMTEWHVAAMQEIFRMKLTSEAVFPELFFGFFSAGVCRVDLYLFSFMNGSVQSFDGLISF